MKKQIKNYGKSVRTKLLRLTKTSSHQYMYLLARYFTERLLYRLSASEYNTNFILKGGSLLYAIGGLDSRPTVDIDFTANKIGHENGNIENVFREIAAVPCTTDGVLFDTDSLRSETITVDKKYPGIRLHIKAHMDTIEHDITIAV